MTEKASGPVSSKRGKGTPLGPERSVAATPPRKNTPSEPVVLDGASQSQPEENAKPYWRQAQLLGILAMVVVAFVVALFNTMFARTLNDKNSPLNQALERRELIFGNEEDLSKDPLGDMLESFKAEPDPAKRAQRAEVLGYCADERVVPVLEDVAANDPDPTVREAATKALASRSWMKKKR